MGYQLLAARTTRRQTTGVLLALCAAAGLLDCGQPAWGRQPPAQGQDAAPAPAAPLSELEQLLQSPVETPSLRQEVTTVTGQVSTVGKSPAAVFVITQEMIRRSGVTSIPEALRMAPGLQVARVNSNRWAITSRGFNTDIAGLFSSNNKLLVLIDGRTVYTPFFNGVFWDVQDLILEDVDRIEVIRGPGATIWGANAVNGVVNIITKRAADTQGGLLQAGGGNLERGFTNARVGGKAGDNVHYRLYGKWFDRDASINPAQQTDDWQQGRSGFRVDWTPEPSDLVTFQGDIYGGKSGFTSTAHAAGDPDFGDDEDLFGGNLTYRWTRTYSDDNGVSLQAYYDRADRGNNVGFIDQQFNTYDIELRHHFPIGSRHKFIWGAGYRIVDDRLTEVPSGSLITIPFTPPSRTYDTVSLFAQDEMAITDSLFLTAGAKLQYNDFTHGEIQPSIRLLYSPDPSWAVWSAVSRAVRTPSRIEHDGAVSVGGVPFLQFQRSFYSDDMIAYELGYRSQPESWFYWDVAAFFNQYEHLASLDLSPAILPIVNTNRNRGEGYGFELSSTIEMTDYWRLTGYYAFLQLQIHPGDGTQDFLLARGTLIEGSSPHNQVFLMSSHDLTQNVDLDFIGRYVDELPIQNVPAYIALDTRLAWRPHRLTELSLVGQNLTDPRHPEYGTQPSQIQRGVYGMLTRRW
jgi:iron complex outermembrane receptor protein